MLWMDITDRMQCLAKHDRSSDILQFHSHLAAVTITVHFPEELQAGKGRGIGFGWNFWNTSCGPEVFSSTGPNDPALPFANRA